MDRSRIGRRAALALGMSVMLVGIVAAPVLADDTVTQDINPGTRTASVGDLDLVAVDYSHSAQAQTGTMTLTADDSTGSNLGWNVTIETSDFVWTAGAGGADSGIDIPDVNFSLTAADAPAMTAGQAVDGAGGPKVPGASPVGTLDDPRKTIAANATFGNGTYTQDLDVNLDIPAYSAAGTYTGTLTVTIAAAP